MSREIAGRKEYRAAATDGRSAVATLVERTSFLILVPLTGCDSLAVGDAVIAATGELPAAGR